MVDNSIISPGIHQYHCFFPWLWRRSDATPSVTEHQGPRFQEGRHHAGMVSVFLTQWASQCPAWMCHSLWVTGNKLAGNGGAKSHAHPLLLWQRCDLSEVVQQFVDGSWMLHCGCTGWMETCCDFLCKYLLKYWLPPPYHCHVAKSACGKLM